ncbi:hypothetical protein ACFO1B_40140 [Dactylosporangium siamense]|uniref:FtsH ternary system domain-containing protein n=1 Tax=Dactylosporangium siamense TaxID=685454 RepID=A0A919UFV7_9ACTN|nr:hypothetical protein [Dactylosporangium siamense]GIG50005.1 hypothetical protein Dsi01nite_080460 [Dactylosporangium siamense]
MTARPRRDDNPGQGRPGVVGRVEPVDRIPPPGGARPAQPVPVQAPAPPRTPPDATAPAADPAPPPRRPVPPVAPTLRCAGRFPSAVTALRCVGELTSTGAEHAAAVHRDGDAWWVVAEGRLDLWRSIAGFTGGRGHVEVGGWLVPDRGFGAAPAAHTPGAVELATLRQVPLLDLVHAAGLVPARPAPQREAAVLTPPPVAPTLIRRALDLGVAVTHRNVRLTPLFEADLPGAAVRPDADGGEVVVELRLRAQSDTLPAALLIAASRQPLTLVCRSAGEGGRLLVQRGLATPVDDDRLAAALGDGDRVLADAAFGCRRLTPLTGFTDSTATVRLAKDFRLRAVPGHSASEATSGTTVETVTKIGLAPVATHGRRVDAALLDDGDLPNIALLLQGHPLADVAFVVVGERGGRHLLAAPGGLLQDLGIGEPLAAVGPGPLYLPLGRRLTPHVPASARHRLFGADAEHAVVFFGDGEALRFPLAARRPVWTLWLGDPPKVLPAVPAATGTALAAMQGEQEPAAAPRPTRRPWPVQRQSAAASADPDQWRAEAHTAELAGDLVRAAELYQRHHEPLRAAHLFERAAREAEQHPMARRRRR